MSVPIYNKQITSLINGVSQQPDAIKFDSQCREQINAFSNNTRGLTKRAPTKHIQFLGDIPDGAYIHFVERDSVEQYFLVIHNGTIRAFDINGNEKTVTNNAGVDYLSVPNGKKATDVFSALTISDVTILVNNSKVVSETTSITAPVKKEGLVYVKEGKYGKTYGVRIVRKSDGAIIAGISFNTPDGSTASDVYKVATDYIAKQIKDALENSFILFPPSEQFTVEHDGGSIVKISSNIAEDFSIITSDGFGDQIMYAIKDNVTLFSDLPRHAPDGFTVKVSGNAEALAAQGYYVKATKSTPSSTGTGFPLVTWVECPAQGISKGLDNTTMPISIKRNQDGTFTIERITYGERVVGDLETSPSPKFVGNKIGGAFFYSNRLGFFSNDSISMSGSGDLFSFFPTSVATVLATDNLEVSINSPRVSLIRHVIPWNEACIIFSDTHQYVMKSNGALSVETLSIQPATDFHVNTRATPRASGTNIYFANEHGKYTEVREYYVNNLTTSKEASNITAHVPTYIPSGATWISCSGNSNSMVVFSENDKRNLYIYQTQWAGDEKVQSAWHKFNFGKYEIVCGFFKGEDLYLIVRKYGYTSTQLVSLNFSNDYVEGVAPFIIYLDNRVSSSQVTMTYSEEQDQTTVTLPFDVDELTKVVDARETERYYGNLIAHTNGLLSTQVVLKGDYRNISLYFGDIYEMRYNLGHVYIRNNNNQGSTVRTTGVTTILKLLVTYGDSCEFKVLIDTEGRTKKYTEFHGRVKGDFDNNFGKINPESGVFKVGVGAKNDKTDIVFINDSHLPCSIQFLDFVLRYWNSNGSMVG